MLLPSLLLLLLPQIISSAPTNSTGQQLRTRREWRDLSPSDQQAYLDAVACTHKLPAVYTNSSLSRYEDYAHLHSLQTPYVHWGAQFLPYHRAFLHTYLHTLHTECTYPSHLDLPYWDYTLDSTDLRRSPILQPTSFGTDGLPIPFNASDYPPRNLPDTGGAGGGCIKDSMFANWTVAPTREHTLNPRCIRRSVNTRVASERCTPQAVKDLMAGKPGFEDFQWRMMGTPPTDYDKQFALHLCGHYIVGGKGAGADPWVGPLEPLWWLHHVNLDRLWVEWQGETGGGKGVNRELAGAVTPEQERFPDTNYTGWRGEGVDLSEDWVLDMDELGESVKVADILDITELGYQYA